MELAAAHVPETTASRPPRELSGHSKFMPHICVRALLAARTAALGFRALVSFFARPRSRPAAASMTTATRELATLNVPETRSSRELADLHFPETRSSRELAFRNRVPEHEMAVAPHRRGPNGKLMTPIDRGTDVLWRYVAVGPRLLAFISLFLAQTGGRFAHWFPSLCL